MIQRIQSVFLLLVGVIALVIVNSDAPFFIEKSTKEGMVVSVDFNSTEMDLTGEPSVTVGPNNGLIYMLYATGILAILSIFLYKKRKLQSRFIMGVIVCSVIVFVDMYWYTLQMDYFEEASDISFKILAIVPISLLLFSILALRGVLKDESLVRSLDRIR